MRWLWAWIIRMLYKLTRPIVGKNSDTTSDLIPSNSTFFSSENTEYHYYVTQQEDDDDDNNVGLDINF